MPVWMLRQMTWSYSRLVKAILSLNLAACLTTRVVSPCRITAQSQAASWWTSWTSTSHHDTSRYVSHKQVLVNVINLHITPWYVKIRQTQAASWLVYVIHNLHVTQRYVKDNVSLNKRPGVRHQPSRHDMIRQDTSVSISVLVYVINLHVTPRYVKITSVSSSVMEYVINLHVIPWYVKMLNRWAKLLISFNQTENKLCPPWSTPPWRRLVKTRRTQQSYLKSLGLGTEADFKLCSA